MPRIAIIRCEAHADSCAGFKCFPAVRERTAAFAAYEEVPEIVGFDSCGGCDRNQADKIVARARRLREKGAEAIHLGNCLINVCPWTELFAESIAREVALPVRRGTH